MPPASLDEVRELIRQSRLGEAASFLSQRIKEQPQDHESLNLLGDVLLRMGHVDKARSCFLLAIRVSDTTPGYHYNLGLCDHLAGDLASAILHYEKCLSLNSGHLQASMNLSLLHLQASNLRRGFCLYRQRVEVQLQGDPYPVDQDFLAKLKDKCLILHADQGLGDQIFFLRFLQYLPDLGVQSLHWKGDARLDSLVRDLSPLPVLEQPLPSSPQCFVGDLPYLTQYHETMGFPKVVEIKPKPQLCPQDLFHKLTQAEGLKVGIIWRAGIRNSAKEISLGTLLDCLKGLWITPVIMQREVTEQEIYYLKSVFPNAIDASSTYTDWEATQGVLSMLDLQLGVSNTNCYLGEHLGIKSYVLVRHPIDFRFSIRNASGWFSHASCFYSDQQSGYGKAIRDLQTTLIQKLPASIDSDPTKANKLFQLGFPAIALKILDDKSDVSSLFCKAEILRQQGQTQEAGKILNEILASGISDAALTNSLARCEFESNPSLAIELLKDSSHPVQRLNLAGMLNQEGEYQQALSVIKSCALDPGLLLAVLKEKVVSWTHLGEWELAYQELANSGVGASDLDVNHQMSVLASLTGRLLQGFELSAFRPSARATARGPLLDRPQVLGKVVWVSWEQGLGDELFYLRWMQILNEQGAKFIAYRPSSKLLPMLREQKDLPFSLLPQKALEPDVCLMVGDLPYVCQDAGDSLIALPLKAESKRVEKFLKLYENLPRPWIGITWRAGVPSGHKVSKSLFKEVPLQSLLSDFAGRGTCFVVQRNPSAEELQICRSGHGQVVDVSAANEDLCEMLAVMACLDDYWTVSNTNIYLRESLGLSAKVYIPWPPDFRWGKEKSPWLRTMKQVNLKPSPNPDVVVSDFNHLQQKLLALIQVRDLVGALKLLQSFPWPKEATQQVQIHQQMGALLLETGDATRAKSNFLKALSLNKTAENHLMYANACALLHEFSEAKKHYLLALQLNPLYAEGYRNLLVLLLKMKQAQEAFGLLLKAESQGVDHPDFRHLEVQIYHSTGQFSAAEKGYRELLLKSPHDDALANSMAQILLVQEKYSEGFSWYCQRPSARTVDGERLPLPVVKPEIFGLRLRVLQEQGLGDELFFLRALPVLISLGLCEFSYKTESSLRAQFERLGYLHYLNQDVLAKDECTLLLGDLPWLLSGRVTFPLPSLKITPDAVGLQSLRQRYPVLFLHKYVGLTWRAGQVLDSKRGEGQWLSKELPFEQVLKVAETIRRPLAVMQRFLKHSEFQLLKKCQSKVKQPILDLSDLASDIPALISALDHLEDYICVSNTNLHIREALGHKSSLFVPFPPEFRHGLDEKVSLWFPNTQTYRQTAQGSWAEAVTKFKESYHVNHSCVHRI